jgi:hypothetical protein
MHDSEVKPRRFMTPMQAKLANYSRNPNIFGSKEEVQSSKKAKSEKKLKREKDLRM